MIDDALQIHPKSFITATDGGWTSSDDDETRKKSIDRAFSNQDDYNSIIDLVSPNRWVQGLKIAFDQLVVDDPQKNNYSSKKRSILKKRDFVTREIVNIIVEQRTISPLEGNKLNMYIFAFLFPLLPGVLLVVFDMYDPGNITTG